MHDLATEAAAALKPIARPMWWLDPDDEDTYDIWDQFAVGDDLIVAPVSPPPFLVLFLVIDYIGCRCQIILGSGAASARLNWLPHSA